MWKWIFIGLGVYAIVCIVLAFYTSNKDKLKCPKCGKSHFRQDYDGFNPSLGYTRIEYDPIGYQWMGNHGARLYVFEKRKEVRYWQDHRKFVCENCGHVLKEEDIEMDNDSKAFEPKRTKCPKCDSKNYEFWFENRVDTPNLLEGDYKERCLDCGYTETNHYRMEVDDKEIAKISAEKSRDHAKYMRKQEKYFKEHHWEPKKYSFIDEYGCRVTLTQVSKYSSDEYRDNKGRIWTKTGSNTFRLR